MHMIGHISHWAYWNLPQDTQTVSTIYRTSNSKTKRFRVIIGCPAFRGLLMVRLGGAVTEDAPKSRICIVATVPETFVMQSAHEYLLFSLPVLVQIPIAIVQGSYKDQQKLTGKSIEPNVLLESIRTDNCSWVFPAQ